MKKCVLPFMVLLFLAGFSLKAQQETIELDAQATVAVYVGKTPPLKDLAPRLLTPKAKLDALKKNGPKNIPNFFGREIRAQSVPGALPKGPDAVWQAGQDKNSGVVVEPIINIDGLGKDVAGNLSPPDPDGEVGSDYFVQMINATSLQVYDKDGTEVGSPLAVNTLWNSVGFSSAGDPIILFDQEVDRWIVTEFAPPGQNTLLVGISEDSDPLGSYDVYNFSAPNFPDYPKYSIWPNAIVVTTNEGGPIPLYVIDRLALLNTEPTVDIQRLTVPRITGGPGFQVLTPVDWTGDTPPPAGANPMVIRLNDDGWGSTPEDLLEVYEIDIDWDNPNNSAMTGPENIATAPYDSYPCAISGPGFSCIPQPNGAGIDGLPEVIMNRVSYRNFGSHESMVLNFITDATGTSVSGIRWYELRRTPGNDWSIFQEGTFAPDDGKHRFMGAIGIDGAGNIGMAYSISSDDTFPSLAFTGRRSDDPPGEMTVEEYVVVEGQSNNPSIRYGDYAAMSVDPVDDRTFWFTGEYMSTDGDWATRIISFQITRDSNDLAPFALISPMNSPNLTDSETVEITVRNTGINTQNNFEVGLIVDNNLIAIDPVNVTIDSAGEYNHTFLATVDLSVVGDYEFRLFTNLVGDENPSNDTLDLIVRKLPRWDAGIGNILGVEDLICDDDVTVELEIKNFGTETLTSADIEWQLNDDPAQTINWTGSLASGEFELIEVPVGGLQSGTNTITASTSNPNGEVDEIMSNDGTSRDFQAVLDGQSITFVLATDFAPDETTWTLEDENGNILYQGGPYITPVFAYFEEWCLEEDKCYTFTIFDSFGDGLSEGNGSYNIVNEQGAQLASIMNINFGSQESNEFCVTACSFDVEVDLTPETEPGTADGAIMLTPTSGTGPFQYSIDGGQTFQASGLFEDLPAGDYDVVILAANECEYEETITLPVCALDVMVSVTNASAAGANDGVITINVTNGTEPYLYSIDGGGAFEFENTFTGLAPGTYNVVVRDDLGCAAFEFEITVGVGTSVGTVNYGYLVEVFPNPTQGLFRINMEGLDGEQELKLQIFDAQGRILQHNRLLRYDQTLTGQLSLLAYPAGTYYIRFQHEDVKQLIKIIKQ